MSLTDAVAKKTIGFGNIVHDEQMRRQCLIVQQVDISHIDQHQSRFGVFVHPEIKTKLVLEEKSDFFHILDQI